MHVCFYSIRRLHTRGALVTGVQSCALPISRMATSRSVQFIGPDPRSAVMDRPNYITPAGLSALRAEYDALFATERPQLVETIAWAAGNGDRSENGDYRSEERRVGKEGVSTFRSRWSPSH